MFIISKNKPVAYDFLYIIIVKKIDIIVQSDVYTLMIKMSKISQIQSKLRFFCCNTSPSLGKINISLTIFQQSYSIVIVNFDDEVWFIIPTHVIFHLVL